MNRDILKGQWKQISGDVKRHWGRFTDNDMTQIEGNFDKLAGMLQERYGYQKDQAEREINDFLARHPELTASGSKTTY